MILGAGGVVSSIIYALNKMKALEIAICNRTKSKAEDMKSLFNNLIVINWGEVSDFDMIINATSIGLNKEDRFDLDLSKFKNSNFFYDIIYNPPETHFLRVAQNLGKKTENGKRMFIHQAAQAFKIWHGIRPEIDDSVNKIIDK